MNRIGIRVSVSHFWMIQQFDCGLQKCCSGALCVKRQGTGWHHYVFLVPPANQPKYSTPGCLTPWLAQHRYRPIHAATMVTAGIYMIARSNILYARAYYWGVVAVIGLATAFAASIALENDIKKCWLILRLANWVICSGFGRGCL